MKKSISPKKKLHFSISLILLVSCITGMFFLWQNTTDKQDKKARLDNYYFKKLSSDYSTSKYLSTPMKDAINEWNLLQYLLQKTKTNMLEDGYDRAEIQALEDKAQDAEVRILWAREDLEKREATINAKKSA